MGGAKLLNQKQKQLIKTWMRDVDFLEGIHHDDVHFYHTLDIVNGDTIYEFLNSVINWNAYSDRDRDTLNNIRDMWIINIKK